MTDTNFPDFSSYLQEEGEDEFNYTPTAPTQQPTTPQTKTSEMERFWAIAGNWGEFGLSFGLGLCGSLIVRAIPVLQPGAIILIPAVGAGLAALSFAAPENRVRYQVFLIATTAAVIGGNWDAWMSWFLTNAWKVGLTLLLIGVGVYFVPTGGKKNV